jgi:hypothetical protein
MGRGAYWNKFCNGIISSNIYVVLNTNFHSNVNVLGRFYQQFLTSLYRSTLFGIFLKPDSKQKVNSLKDLFSQFCQFKDIFCNIKVNASFILNAHKSSCYIRGFY